MRTRVISLWSPYGRRWRPRLDVLVPLEEDGLERAAAMHRLIVHIGYTGGAFR